MQADLAHLRHPKENLYGLLVMDGDCFAAQEAMVPPVTGFLLHIFSGYPRLTAWVDAVEHFFQEQGGHRPLPGAPPVSA